MKLFFHQQKKPFDFWLLTAVIFLSLLGILFIFEASSVTALRTFSNQYHFVREQSIWFGLGLIIMIAVSFFDYHRLYKLALPIIIATIFLLLAVFLPGIGVWALGAHRWVNLGFTTFQPAEFVKLALVIYLSAWFSYKEKGRLLAFTILVGLVVGLVVLEPDLGTAIIISAIALMIFFLSGAPLRHFLALIPLGLLAVLGLAAAAPYRLNRIKTFLNPEIDPLGMSYHLRQILLALGSGGLFGQGLGRSRQKFEYLPEAMTDSIFAIIAEEIGFFGAIIFIFIIMFIVYRGIKIAFSAPDRFGQLLAFGVSFWLAVQSIINLGSMVAIMPLTGIPLPFVSYGGSSLVVNITAIGILLNISRQCLVAKRK